MVQVQVLPFCLVLVCGYSLYVENMLSFTGLRYRGHFNWSSPQPCMVDKADAFTRSFQRRNPRMTKVLVQGDAVSKWQIW